MWSTLPFKYTSIYLFFSVKFLLMSNQIHYHYIQNLTLFVSLYHPTINNIISLVECLTCIHWVWCEYSRSFMDVFFNFSISKLINNTDFFSDIFWAIFVYTRDINYSCIIIFKEYIRANAIKKILWTTYNIYIYIYIYTINLIDGYLINSSWWLLNKSYQYIVEL